MKLRKISAVAAAASAVALGTALLFSGTATAGAVTTDPSTVTPTTSTKPVDVNATICKDDEGPDHLKVHLEGVTLLSGESVEGANAPDDSGPAGTATVSPDGTTLTVEIFEGWTATGIVVKGGAGYYIYEGPFVGPVVVEGLVAPPVGQDNTPQISHYFVCGGTTPDESPSPSPSVSPSPDPSDPTDPSTTTATPSTSTTPGLPVTGGALTGLIAAGVLLVAGGGATLFLLRRRRAALGE